MKTIYGIKFALDFFEEQVCYWSHEKSDEKYKEKLCEIEDLQMVLFKALRKVNPIMVPLITKDESTFSTEEATTLFNRIIECANFKKELDMVFTGACASQVIQRISFAVPKYINFKGIPNVLISPYKEQRWEDFAVRMMNQIILGSLLSLPLGKVRVNFINPSMSNKANLFIGNISFDLCRAFIDKNEIEAFVDSLTIRLKNYIKYGVKRETGQPDYDIIVLLDYPYMYDDITEKMRPLVEQGGQIGLHFIVLNDLRRSFEKEGTYDLLCQKQFFAEFGAYENAKQEDYDKIFTFTYELASQPELLKLCLNHLSAFIQEGTTETTESEGKEYTKVDNGLNVPIGKPMDRKTMDFCLGQDGHVHSFIIGRSGTGKSILLHDIIIEAIHKYSPHDLQLYLLDCKLGGVEFNQYRNIKHARALLVDNSDIQIILEILRDLGEQMKERGKLLRDAGVTKIDDYNASNPDNRLSRIWVIIDECHVLFEQSSMSNRRLRGEIIEIITKVATEGRNQGVHLIMATQTLANADIPTSILNNITDRYALNCAPLDAEKMWSGCSKQNANLNVGDVLYHNTSGVFPETQFHATYFTKNEIEKRISSAVSKAADYASNGQFYFNGSQVFCFDEEIEDLLGNSKKQNLKACVGRSITLRQTPVLITLKQGISENILLTGLDDLEQTTRTAIDVLLSLVMSNAKNNLNYKIYVFDYKDDDSGQYQGILEYLECEGIISIVSKRQQGIFYKQLAEDIKNETAKPTILFILGQQRFRELNLNVEIEEKPAVNDAFGAMNFTSTKGGIKTYKDALSYILDNGPDLHVHTVLQVDKPSNLLFEDFVSRKFIFRKFRHLILLKSEQNVMTNLGLSDDIRLESLSSDNERLRAIYYADGDDGWTLFSPFAFPDESYLFTIKK